MNCQFQIVLVGLFAVYAAASSADSTLLGKPECVPFTQRRAAVPGGTCEVCSALIQATPNHTCEQYCQGLGQTCLGQAEEVNENCGVEDSSTCSEDEYILNASGIFCKCIKQCSTDDDCASSVAPAPTRVSTTAPADQTGTWEYCEPAPYCPFFFWVVGPVGIIFSVLCMWMKSKMQQLPFYADARLQTIVVYGNCIFIFTTFMNLIFFRSAGAAGFVTVGLVFLYLPLPFAAAVIHNFYLQENKSMYQVVKYAARFGFLPCYISIQITLTLTGVPVCTVLGEVLTITCLQTGRSGSFGALVDTVSMAWGVLSLMLDPQQTVAADLQTPLLDPEAVADTIVTPGKAHKLRVLIFGNPGSGKSTLANSLAGKLLFPSGFASGEGLTKGMSVGEGSGGTEYVDLPGISDVMLRKEAAHSSTAALKQSCGKDCQILFVFTGQQGRIRPEDRTTMQLVLRAAPEIGDHYAMIFNQCSPKMVKRSEDPKWKASFQGVALSDVEHVTKNIFYLPMQPDLDGMDNKLMDFKLDFKQFISKVPTVRLTEDKVGTIEPEDYDNFLKELAKKMKAGIKDLEKLRKINRDLEEQEKREEEEKKRHQEHARYMVIAGGAAVALMIFVFSILAALEIRMDSWDVSIWGGKKLRIMIVQGYFSIFYTIYKFYCCFIVFGANSSKVDKDHFQILGMQFLFGERYLLNWHVWVLSQGFDAGSDSLTLSALIINCGQAWISWLWGVTTLAAIVIPCLYLLKRVNMDQAILVKLGLEDIIQMVISFWQIFEGSDVILPASLLFSSLFAILACVEPLGRLVFKLRSPQQDEEGCVQGIRTMIVDLKGRKKDSEASTEDPEAALNLLIDAGADLDLAIEEDVAHILKEANANTKDLIRDELNHLAKQKAAEADGKLGISASDPPEKIVQVTLKDGTNPQEFLNEVAKQVLKKDNVKEILETWNKKAEDAEEEKMAMQREQRSAEEEEVTEAQEVSSKLQSLEERMQRLNRGEGTPTGQAPPGFASNLVEGTPSGQAPPDVASEAHSAVDSSLSGEDSAHDDEEEEDSSLSGETHIIMFSNQTDKDIEMRLKDGDVHLLSQKQDTPVARKWSDKGEIPYFNGRKAGTMLKIGGMYILSESKTGRINCTPSQ